MWQLDWAALPPDDLVPTPRATTSPEDQGAPTHVGGLMWEEHCHECAEPDCYSTCPLYVARRDRRCARLEYGIHPNTAFSGLYPFGAEVKFRRWGKLESVMPVRRLSVEAARRLTTVDRTVTTATKSIDGLRGWPARHQVTSAYRSSRIRALRGGPETEYDAFLVEVWSAETTAHRLVIECRRDGSPYFRESLTVEPGWNRLSLPAAALLAGATDPSARVLVYPENDARLRCVFTWLDFVAYASPAVPPRDAVPSSPAEVPEPAERVKCVVWDLDNTLWKGILADLGPEELVLAPGVRELIEGLDQRGILQSVASKNTHDEAWSVITRLGLEDMFLHPAINWGPKSASIRSIAEALNIGLDTLAFVDDSPVERAEVGSALPQVRVYSEDEISTLLDQDAFDVRPSAEGRQRRLSYLAEARRMSVASSSAGDIEDFLRSCAIELEVSEPDDDASMDRCHELLQRSNQLNLTTRRYSRDELEALRSDPARTPLALRVRDRFGDYGLVGFVSLAVGDDGALLVQDLVLSCRVAKKYVENAFMEVLRSAVADRVAALELTFVPTARNAPLLEALRSLGLDAAPDDIDGPTTLRLVTDRPVALSDVVHATTLDARAKRRIEAMLAPASTAAASASGRE